MKDRSIRDAMVSQYIKQDFCYSDLLQSMLDRQTRKGVEKYGTTIEEYVVQTPSPIYDLLNHAVEESIDLLTYISALNWVVGNISDLGITVDEGMKEIGRAHV